MSRATSYYPLALALYCTMEPGVGGPAQMRAYFRKGLNAELPLISSARNHQDQGRSFRRVVPARSI